MSARGKIGVLAACAALLLLVACGGTEARVPDARNQPKPSETLIVPDPPQRMRRRSDTRTCS